MRVEQKSYAQIVIVDKDDFVFSHVYGQYEAMCPFMCFPGIVAPDFRASLKKPESIVNDKDIILLLEEYWGLLSHEEQKAVLDHELGHISSGHLKAIAEQLKRGNFGGPRVDEGDEKQADAYSASLNGKKAMYHSLIKAIDVMVGGYRAKGYRISTSAVIDGQPILKNRLAVLKEEETPK